MPDIPDRDPNQYARIAHQFRQARQKVRKLDDAYIDATNNKILFKEIRDIFVDIGKILKTMNGIQRDDDPDN
jgi:hypothetical protein